MEMSQPEYIDLSDNDDDVVITKASGEKHSFDHKRPASLALKNIGLSLIKLQYFDNNSASSVKDVSNENGVKKRDDDLWKLAWIDESKTYNSYLRQILEQRFDKAYKCVLCRSRFCQNQGKMTRLNWIHHARRGHIRIDYSFRKVLKKNYNNIGTVFEIYCVLCSKSKRLFPMSPPDFVQHMKKNHPQFLPYTEYFSYFQRCFICNDQTRSFQQNLSHRQLCIAALLKDPNQVGTENFNNCFKLQRMMPTVSLEPNPNPRMNFDIKWKQATNLKKSSYYFLSQLKKNGLSNPSQWPQNGCSPKPVILHPSLLALRRNIASNKNLINCSLTIGDRIAPGTKISGFELQKFFMPVPFFIKNDTLSKKTYVKWKKSVKVEHQTIQSSMPWYCEICNGMLRNIKSAYCHIKMCHPSTTFHETNCKSCNKRFLTNQGYKNHFHGQKKCPIARRCVICNVSVSINDIYEHMSLMHKEQLNTLFELQTCFICRNSVDDIHSHLFDIHGMSNAIQTENNDSKVNYRNGSFFNCTKCSLTYFSEVELRNHMILNDHHLQCEKCPTLKFYLSWELMYHLSVAHKPSDTDDKFSCHLCQKTPVKCESVNKPRFSTSSEQVKHFMQVHLSPCTVLLDDILKK